MKTLEKHVKKTVLIASAMVLAALLAGRYLAAPVALALQSTLRDFVLGCGVVALVITVANSIQVAVLNIQACRAIEDSFPRSVDEVRRLGVETPVDFAFMMGVELCYMRHSFFAPVVIEDRYARPQLMKLGRRMFREMFGRDPLGCETGDIDRIACLETASLLGRDGEIISQDDFFSHVSDRVKRHYKDNA